MIGSTLFLCEYNYGEAGAYTVDGFVRSYEKINAARSIFYSELKSKETRMVTFNSLHLPTQDGVVSTFFFPVYLRLIGWKSGMQYIYTVPTE